jgi:hypothetical protein
LAFNTSTHRFTIITNKTLDYDDHYGDDYDEEVNEDNFETGVSDAEKGA